MAAAMRMAPTTAPWRASVAAQPRESSSHARKAQATATAAREAGLVEAARIEAKVKVVAAVVKDYRKRSWPDEEIPQQPAHLCR